MNIPFLWIILVNHLFKSIYRGTKEEIERECKKRVNLEICCSRKYTDTIIEYDKFFFE